MDTVIFLTYLTFFALMSVSTVTSSTGTISIIDLAKSTDSLFGGNSVNLHQSMVSFTTSESFLAIPRWNSGVNMSLSMKFRTSEANGVIIYTNGVKNYPNDGRSMTVDNRSNKKTHDTDTALISRDFFALELLDGLLYAVLNMGTGSIKVKSTVRRVDNGQWHEVAVNLTGRMGVVTVNGRHVTFVAPPDTAYQYNLDQIPHLDLEGPLYIGSIGSPGIVSRSVSQSHFTNLLSPAELWSGSLGHGFVGCIGHLSLNDQSVDLIKFTGEQDSTGVQIGCNHSSSSAQCTRESCVHGATCTEGWNRVICSCHSLGYIGVNCARESLVVSLQGGQYIRLNLPVRSITQAEDIYLRFRTSVSEGLIFLAGERDDEEDYEDKGANFLALILESSRLKVIINLGEGNKVTYVTTSVGDTLADDTWHWIKIERRGPSLEITLDGVNLVTEITGQASNLIVNTFYLGSLSSKHRIVNKSGIKWSPSHQSDHEGRHSFISTLHPSLQATLKDTPGFTGLLQSVIYNGINLFESSRTGLLSGLFNSTGEFNLNTGRLTDNLLTSHPRHFHNAVTFKSRHTYVAIAGLKVYSHMKLHFQFKTLANNGVILYNEGKSHHQYIAVELHSGQLVYAFNLGDGGRKLISSSANSGKLNDNQWHSVTIMRSINNLHTLTVDDSMVSLESPGVNGHLSMASVGYLGGLPSHLYSSNALPKLLNSRHGYEGCLAFIEFNGLRIDPIIESDSVLTPSTLVQGGCSLFSLSNDDKYCTLYSCSNRGSCVPLPSQRRLLHFTPTTSTVITNLTTSSVCDCDEATFVSSTCSLEGISLRFTQSVNSSQNSESSSDTTSNGSQYQSSAIITYIIKESAQSDHKEDFFSFGLVTNQANAVIVRIDSSTSSDFIELQLINGSIVVIYNLGYEDHEITSPGVRVDDDRYHVIRFNRTGPNSTLEIDNHNVIHKIPHGKQLELFDFMGKVQIGGKRQMQSPFPPITLSMDASRLSNSTRKLPNFHGILSAFNLNGENLFDLASSILFNQTKSTSPFVSSISSSNFDVRFKKEGRVDFLTHIPRIFNPSNVHIIFNTTSPLPSVTNSDSNVHHHTSGRLYQTGDTRDTAKVSISHLTSNHNGHSSDLSFKDELILSQNSFSCWSDYDCIDRRLSPSSTVSPFHLNQLTTVDSLPDDLITPIFTHISTFHNETLSPLHKAGDINISSGTASVAVSSTPRPCADEDDEDCFEEIGSGDITDVTAVEEETDDINENTSDDVVDSARKEDTREYTSTSKSGLYEFKPWPTFPPKTVTSVIFFSPPPPPASTTVFESSTLQSVVEIEQTYRPKLPSITPPTRSSSSSSLFTSQSSSKSSIVDVPKPPARKNKLSSGNYQDKVISGGSVSKNPTVKPVSGTSSSPSSSLDRTALVIGIIATIIILIVFVAPIVLFTKIRMTDANAFAFTPDVPYVSTLHRDPSKSCHLVEQVSSVPKQFHSHQYQQGGCAISSSLTTGNIVASSGVPLHMTNSASSDIKYHQMNQSLHSTPYHATGQPRVSTYATYQRSTGTSVNGPTSILKKKNCPSSKNEFEWFV